MLGKKEIMTAGGALAVAFAIGFVMQSGDAAEQRYATSSGTIDRPAPVHEVKLPDSGTLLQMEEITLTSAEAGNAEDVPPTHMPTVLAAMATSPSRMPILDERMEVDAPGCKIDATARAKAAAMVVLDLDAPCLPNERITVHHNGMIFTETTSDRGQLSVEVPALAQDAVFILAFTNGEGAIARTEVEDLGDFDRVVLQWKGDTGFQIHAREYGADYGSPGHVWSGAPGEAAATVLGKGGMLTRNGDSAAADPLLTEVYTFPKDAKPGAGEIALSVETEIDKANCGIEVEAQTLEIVQDGKIRTQNVTLPVPDCDTPGGFLVLNNLLQNLKVARK